MNKWAIAASLVMGMALTGCATTVKPSYVSPTQYQALNCTQLQSEYDRIQHYLEQGVEPEKRTGVGVGVGVGGGWGRGGWGLARPSRSIWDNLQILNVVKSPSYSDNRMPLYRLRILKTAES